MMDTSVGRSSVGAEEIQVPPGFVSRTAFVLKRMASTEDTPLQNALPVSSTLEDTMLKVDLLIQQRAWIIHDQLDHHEEESDHESSHQGMQVSPATLQAEGIPVHRCIQHPKEFMPFLPLAYHTGVHSSYNVSESVCFAPLDWLPPGLSVTELISNDKLLLKAAHQAVKAHWMVVLKNETTPEYLKWKAACGKGSVLAKALKDRVESEARQREYLCTSSQSRKMDKFFDKGARKECWVCNFNLYLSAVFCPCNPNKYSCLKHTKHLCRCAWSEKVFLFRYNITDLNLLAGAIQGNFDEVFKWVKKDYGEALEDDTDDPNVHVIPEDAPSLDKALVLKGEMSSSSIDGTHVKEDTKKLVSETVARILKASKSKCLDLWTTAPGDSSSDSLSGSDDESFALPVESKGEKPLPASLSASNDRSVGSSKLVVGKQKTKSSGKSEAIICLSSDNED